jgi:GWxTD domain-containing protein
MKNRFLAIILLAFCCIFTGSAGAQQSSVSFNKKGISIIFNIKASSPEASKQSLGSVYFTGYEDGEKESRVHRVLADRESGAYFGYDLVIESDSSAPNKFKVSVRPLSINPPEQMRLGDLTARSLPKYPEDMVVEDGDTIALDVLINPQTKVKIVDLIKITTKKPQSSDSPLFNAATAAGYNIATSVGSENNLNSNSKNSSGSGSNDSLFSKQKPRDFTPNDVKLRLTSPKFFASGAISSLLGSQWEGIIEGTIIHIYIPGKGRYIFSLFPQNGFNFQKNAVIEDNKIIFQSDDDRYELVSAAPILSNGGSWNLWTLHDSAYRPDLIFSAAAAGYIQYGASNEVENVLKQEWRKSRLIPVRSQKDKTEIYARWLDDIRYIINDAEEQAFSRLKSNAEREQFIESFWQRRDPKPETKENEFRREYYSRIAYANQNFAFGETAGGLTDRGRIFIKYGKPNDIQKNEAGEVWIYKSLNGLGDNVRFEFFDASKNGDFRLRQ